MISLWITLALFFLMFEGLNDWSDYLWLSVSLLIISIYFYEFTNQYLSIKSGYLYKNKPFSKKIKLEEIKRVQRFGGDYIISTHGYTLTINTAIIEEDGLNTLNNVLSFYEQRQNPEA